MISGNRKSVEFSNARQTLPRTRCVTTEAKKGKLQLTFSVFRFTVAGKLIGESIRQTLAGNFACKKRKNCD